jgi:dihydrofolate reductase
MGHSILFGRKTYESIPSKLLGRNIYVLSSTKIFESQVKSITNHGELLKLFSHFAASEEVLYICGGKTVYEKYYHYAKELIVTEIKGEFKGNVYLKLDLKKYKKTLIKKSEKFSIYKYTK